MRSWVPSGVDICGAERVDDRSDTTFFDGDVASAGGPACGLFDSEYQRGGYLPGLPTRRWTCAPLGAGPLWSTLGRGIGRARWLVKAWARSMHAMHGNGHTALDAKEWKGKLLADVADYDKDGKAQLCLVDAEQALQHVRQGLARNLALVVLSVQPQREASKWVGAQLQPVRCSVLTSRGRTLLDATLVQHATGSEQCTNGLAADALSSTVFWT